MKVSYFCINSSFIYTYFWHTIRHELLMSFNAWASQISTILTSVRKIYFVYLNLLLQMHMVSVRDRWRTELLLRQYIRLQTRWYRGGWTVDGIYCNFAIRIRDFNQSCREFGKWIWKSYRWSPCYVWFLAEDYGKL